MKHLSILAGLLAALPAAAHDAGPVAHGHPHGLEAIVALVAIVFLAGAIWQFRR